MFAVGVKVRKPKGRQAWCVVIDHPGQRRTVAVGTREAAERVRREIEARLALGETVEPQKPATPRLQPYAQEWLQNIELERKPSTAGFYGQYLRLYVLPKFGEQMLDAIRREDVKAFIAALRQKGLARNTIRLAVTTLRAVLNAAIEDRLIEHNPAHGLGRFVKSEKPAREAVSLRPSDVEKLLAAAREHLEWRDYALIATAVRAGLRQGEIAGLRWADVHLGSGPNDPDRCLIIQRNYDRRWSRTMLTPKNRKSRRVDLSRELREILLMLHHQKATEGWADPSGNLVFPSEAGTPIEMNNFYARVFKPLLARAGLRPMRFHDLRHTFGTLLIQAGAPLAYVRDQMGHSSIQVTVDVYGHLVPGANVAFMDKVDTLTGPRQSAIQPQYAPAAEYGSN